MNRVYILLFLVFVSLIFPAWAVFRQSQPSFKAHGLPQPFQIWYIGGFFWFAVALCMHVLVMVTRIGGYQTPLMAMFAQMQTIIIFSVWAIHCAVGGIVWFTEPHHTMYAYWQYLCIFLNIGFLIFLCMPDKLIGSIILCIAILPVWITCVIVTFRRVGDITSLFLLTGSVAGGIGGYLWLLGRHYSSFFASFGASLWGTVGIIGIATGLIFHVLKKITGMRLYSNTLGLMTLAVLCLMGPWTFLNMYGTSSNIGTVLNVGVGFVGLFVGTNLWMAFARLREKNIDELSARWVSLGSWLPADITSQFVGFGGWCLFIGSILFSISSFQNFSIHLMPTLWREGLMKLIIIGGTGSFYIASAYCAWSEKASTPDARIAEIGYWHFMGGLIVMCLCFLLGGLVLASQTPFHTEVKEMLGIPADRIRAIWQRPFQVGIGVTGVMIFASQLILGINLFRARSLPE